jgi:hypothetical protein
MAKGKNLAGLAALGALGYMLKDKAKDGGEDSNPTRAARPESTETRLESPEDTIKRSMVKAPGDSKPITEDDVVMPEKAVAPAAKLSKKPAVAKRTDTGSGKPANRSILPVEDAMANYKPRYTPPTKAPVTTQGATYDKKPYMPEEVDMSIGRKKGGMVKKMASGGMTASRRGDGIASRGKTRGKMY